MAVRIRMKKLGRRHRPFFPGQPVYALAYDERGGRSRLYAGTESPFSMKYWMSASTPISHVSSPEPVGTGPSLYSSSRCL